MGKSEQGMLQMTEKRFIPLGTTHIKDRKTNDEFYAPCEWELLDLLNEQEQQITELTEELKDYSDANANLEQRITELENEQFKITHTFQTNIIRIIRNYLKSNELTKSEQLLITDLMNYLGLNIEKLSLELEERTK